jgi:hypothetical protein
MCTNLYKQTLCSLSYSNFKVHGLGPLTSITVILIQRNGLKLELYYKILFEYYNRTSKNIMLPYVGKRVIP